MSTEQFIILLASVEAIAVFVLSFTKVSRGWKTILFILFLGIVFCSSTLKLSHVKEKESQEAAQKTKIDQIDTHVKASLTFQDYIEAARMNRQAGRTDDAIYDVGCALKKEPKSAVALNLLGVLYSEKGDIDSALEQYTKIKRGLEAGYITIEDKKDLAMFNINFGTAYKKRDLWKEAKEQLGNALSLDDNNLDCYLKMIETLNRLGQWDELYSLCNKALSKFPSTAKVYTALGLACIALSRFDQGEEALLKAIQVDSTFGRPYLLLGAIYSQKNQPETSIRFVNKALELDPTLVKDIDSLKAHHVLR